MSDLSIVFYTANVIHKPALATQLVLAAEGDIIEVPMNPGVERSHLNIYRQALEGAHLAKTKYIALAEDDILYSPAHFKYRPSPGKFAYNLGCWGFYTWNPSVFSWKGRRNLSQLICERDLFIEAMEERFNKYPDGKVDIGLWAEPGKYERQLGVTVRESEEFYSSPANIMFSHEDALAYTNLGKRKRLGELRATSIPYWGSAQEVAALWEGGNEKD